MNRSDTPPHPKYIWQLYKDNQLRLLPEGNKISYFSNNSTTRYMPNALINTGKHTITVPENLPTDILAKRGILSAGFAEHTRGYYHSRMNVKFNDILVVTKGVLSVKHDAVKTKLKVGEALILPPHRLCDSFVECSRTVVFWLHFKCTPYWNNIFGRDIITKHFSRYDDINSIMHLYLNEVYGDTRSLLLLESCADVLVELIKHEFPNPFSQRQRDDVLRDFIAEVEKSPEKNWTSPEAAAQLGISIKTLDEMCIRHASLTFPKIVLKIRMGKALEMVRARTFTMEEIAEKVGYSTPYSFSRIFKLYYGKSPRHFLGI